MNNGEKEMRKMDTKISIRTIRSEINKVNDFTRVLGCRKVAFI